MDFTNLESQKLNAIQNFYSVAYDRSTSWFYLRTLEKDLKSDKIENVADFEVPGTFFWSKAIALKVVISMQQPKWVFGEKAIQDFQLENYIIENVHHKSNDGWEQSGIEFIKKDIEPHLNFLFQNPFLNIMNLSYMNTESFKGMGKNFVLWWTWYYSVIRIFKTTFQNTR